MSLAKTLGISAAAHVAFLGGVVVLRPPEHKTVESVGVMVEQKKKPDKKKDEEKPKPIEAPEEVLHQPIYHAPKPAPAPPPEPAPQQHTAMNAMPDFGISMSGVGSGGPGVGIAVPTGPSGGGVSKLTAPPPKEKTFGTVKEAVAADSPCTEEIVKAHALGFAQPQYTDDARSAEVEGRVKLKLTVDAQGNVSNVEVLSGLGHGLDQSSIATAKRMKFNPGTACGKPVSSSFIVSFRFALGD